ncbi:MAG: MSMEG_1061 family FMN-dependent PPOX-type flavoprotein [Nocardioidaceae bacterium]
MSAHTIWGTGVSNVNHLRHIMGVPMASAFTKIRYRLDDVHKNWMAASPMVFLATASDQGDCDVSPRGDKPGSVLVLDDATIAIADRPGNRRVVSLEHIVSNPHVGLLFVIPGRGETLRVNGRATLVHHPIFAPRMRVDGVAPELAIVIEIEEIYLHCTKAFARSKLWDPSTWARPAGRDVELRTASPRPAETPERRTWRERRAEKREARAAAGR